MQKCNRNFAFCHLMSAVCSGVAIPSCSNLTAILTFNETLHSNFRLTF